MALRLRQAKLTAVPFGVQYSQILDRFPVTNDDVGLFLVEWQTLYI